MNRESRQPQDIQPLQKDWGAVGNYFSNAVDEIADEIGGAEFVEEVNQATPPDSIWPSPESLQLLENRQSGSVEHVLIRMKELQFEAHRQEVAESQKGRLQKYGKAMLDSLLTELGISDTASSRRRSQDQE